jgi:hypothetical protein
MSATRTWTASTWTRLLTSPTPYPAAQSLEPAELRATIDAWFKAHPTLSKNLERCMSVKYDDTVDPGKASERKDTFSIAQAHAWLGMEG